MPVAHRQYTGRDVFEAAKARMRQAYEEHDAVCVSFSGGKDSLAMLHLAREVAIGEGYADRVNALFYDEELIHRTVIDFVEQFRHLDWLDLDWWALPLASHRYRLGILIDYVQWDPARDPAKGGVGWARERPPWAKGVDDLADVIYAYQRTRRLPQTLDVVFSQNDSADIAAEQHRGRYCHLVGIRCDEALLRYVKIKNRYRHERDAWLTPSRPGSRVIVGNPIYDWHENDVFRYLAECWDAGHTPGTPYAPIYDGQLWAGHRYRVATPVVTEGARHLGVLQATDPELYGAVMRIWPDMAVQHRYHGEWAGSGPPDPALYEGADWNDVQRWVDENLDGKWHRDATRMVNWGRRNPGNWSPPYLLRSFLSDTPSYRRGTLHREPTAEEAEARRATARQRDAVRRQRLTP